MLGILKITNININYRYFERNYKKISKTDNKINNLLLYLNK